MKKITIITAMLIIAWPLFAHDPSARITTKRNQGQIIKEAIEALEDSCTYKAKTDTSSYPDAYTISSATTTGTGRGFSVNYTQTASAVAKAIEALRVNIDADVVTGTWTNAIVGRVDYDTTGNANGGMVAPICSELSLPPASLSGGTYYCLDLEMEAPASYVSHGNSALPTAWINIATYGNATAIGSLEDNSYLFRTDGFTAAAGNIISANAQTIRVFAENSAGTAVARYMVLSQIEDGLGIGVSGTPISITTTPKASIYTTSAATTGNITTAYIKQTMTGAATLNTMEAFEVELYSNVATGDWANAIMAKIDYATNGQVTGTAGVICAELDFPASTVSGGAYFIYEAELNFPTNANLNGRPVALLGANSWGAANAQFDSYGYIVDITGLTAGTSGTKLFETSASIGNVDELTAGLRVLIDGVEYYLVMCTPTDIQD